MAVTDAAVAEIRDLIIRHAPTIRDLDAQFQTDLGFCTAIGPGYWASRPLAFRAAGHLGRVFRRFL